MIDHLIILHVSLLSIQILSDLFAQNYRADDSIRQLLSFVSLRHGHELRALPLYFMKFLLISAICPVTGQPVLCRSRRIRVREELDDAIIDGHGIHGITASAVRIAKAKQRLGILCVIVHGLRKACYGRIIILASKGYGTDVIIVLRKLGTNDP